MAQAPYQPVIGLLLGFIGMVIFAGSLPMTQVVVREIPWWQAWALRSSIAVLASAVLLSSGKFPRLRKAQLPAMITVTIGVVFGFPILVSVAMTEVPSGHGGVVTGLMPLATASWSALLFRDRQRLAFWLGAAVGAGLVLAYSLNVDGMAVQLYPGDWFILGAVVLAAMGYACGAQLTHALTGIGVQCWANVIAGVITLPCGALAWWLLDPSLLSGPGIGALFYLGLGSQLFGFMFWYSGLARGGTGRVSQVMLLMPFVTLLISAQALAESLGWRDIAYCVAVFVVVALTVRLQQRRAAVPPATPQVLN